MCLFLEMLQVKKWGGGERGIFPCHSEYFPHAENRELLFLKVSFVDETIRGNMIYNSFYHLVVNMGKYLP